MANFNDLTALDEKTLDALADGNGIERSYLDYQENPVEISLESRMRVLALMPNGPTDLEGGDNDHVSRSVLPATTVIEQGHEVFVADLP